MCHKTCQNYKWYIFIYLHVVHIIVLNKRVKSILNYIKKRMYKNEFVTCASFGIKFLNFQTLKGLI